MVGTDGTVDDSDGWQWLWLMAMMVDSALPWLVKSDHGKSITLDHLHGELNVPFVDEWHLLMLMTSSD